MPAFLVSLTKVGEQGLCSRYEGDKIFQWERCPALLSIHEKISMPEFLSLADLMSSIEKSGGDFLFTTTCRHLAPIVENPSVLDPKDEEALGSEWMAALLEPNIEDRDPPDACGLPTSPGLRTVGGRYEFRERDQVWPISPATVAYWQKRARQVQNPEMSARYAHLAWAFAKPAGVKPSVEDALLAWKQYLALAAIATEEQSVLAAEALRRAAILTIGLSGAMAPAHLIEVKTAYFNLVSRLPEPHCPLIRHLLMEDLVLGRFSEKFALSEKDEALALTQVRKEFDRDHPSNWVESAAVMIKYFLVRSRKAEADSLSSELVHRLALGAATGDAWVFQHWARKAIPVIQSLGLPEDEEILHRTVEILGPGFLRQLQTTVWSVPVPPEFIAHLQTHMRGLTLMDATHSLLAVLPTSTQVLASYETQNNSLLFKLGARITPNADGVPVNMASGPMSEEETFKRAWKGAVEDLSPIAQYYWRVLMDIHNPSPEQLLSALSESGWIPEGHEPILRRAIEALMVNDYVTFLHLSVPQFEPLLRHLISACGLSTYHVPPGQSNSLETDSLGYLLEADSAKVAVGEEGINFMRTLLVEEPGFNLRNRISHGQMKVEECTQSLSVSCLQALLILARSFPRET